MSWREFWNGTHAIYVDARHKALHYNAIADDIVALMPSPAARVLDHGCGEALMADKVAAACGHLWLYDAAPNVQALLAGRFGRNAGITVLDDAALSALPDGSLDLIVCNSVLQYLKQDELRTLLDAWRPMLGADGRLVLADLIPPDAGAVGETLALLRFAQSGGFLIAALGGLVRTAFGDYRRLRQRLGLTRYSEDALLGLLTQHGYEGARAPRNLGHNQTRMMIVARRAA